MSVCVCVCVGGGGGGGGGVKIGQRLRVSYLYPPSVMNISQYFTALLKQDGDLHTHTHIQHHWIRILNTGIFHLHIHTYRRMHPTIWTLSNVLLISSDI